MLLSSKVHLIVALIGIVLISSCTAQKEMHSSTITKQLPIVSATTPSYHDRPELEGVEVIAPASIGKQPSQIKLPPITLKPIVPDTENTLPSAFQADTFIIKNDAMAIIANQHPIPPILDSICKHLTPSSNEPIIAAPQPTPLPNVNTRLISPRHLTSPKVVEQGIPDYAIEPLITINSEPLSLAKHVAKQPKIYFTVQVGAFEWQIKTNNRFFRKINNQESIKTDIAPNGLYRYMSGYFTNYEEAEEYRIWLKKMGYRDAFVAAYDRFNTRIEWGMECILKEFGANNTTSDLE